MREGAYGELGDGVVDDVEGVVAGEVEHDLDEDRGGVDHRGLDDEQEGTREAELAHAQVAREVPGMVWRRG